MRSNASTCAADAFADFVEIAHSVGDSGRASPDQSAVLFHHACVTGLNRAQLRVVADVGDRSTYTLNQIDEELVGLSFLNDTVNHNLDHSCFLWQDL